MNVEETIRKAQDAITVKRVYGEPYERNGVVVIPAASVQGGGGGGSGESAEGGPGAGAGFGFTARPVGAYVIHGSSVHWEPAVDVNRIAQLGLAATTLVGIAFLLARR